MDRNFQKLSVHRSISLLLKEIDEMSAKSIGNSNPALNQSGSESTEDVQDHGPLSLGCFSLEGDDFDEDLGIPDSVTVLSIEGAGPVLVQRNDNDADSIIVQQSEIPYSYVHNPPVPFKSLKRNIFIPGVEINVEIIDFERSFTTHMLNPNLYTIKFTHGPFTWVTKKRYNHFKSLHSQLSLFRASLNFPFPTKTHKERRTSFRNIKETSGCSNEKQNKKKKKYSLPRFPLKPESLVSVESISERIKQLEEYLYNLLTISLYRNHEDTINFLEVSHLSFISALGEKCIETMVKKRTGSTRHGQAGCNCFGLLGGHYCSRCKYFCADVLCGKWQQRWFFVKETCFGYIKPKDGVLRCVVLFDQGFDISQGMYSTGLRNGLQVVTNSRYLMVKHGTRRKAKDLLHYMKAIANNQARDFTMPNPHSSFAPIRSGMLCGWFVDGAGYMSAVADVLEGATEEIFIADWWLSPEIYMKRPAIDGDYWRLDKILKRKAEQGIKIFILLYKEVELALGINSYYSKQKLVEQHDNIKVLRHPDHARVGVFLWAHHEKLVVIDQTYAFVGGIDLCYGRWDDHKHRLTDLGSISSKEIGLKKISTAVSVEHAGSALENLMKNTKEIAVVTSFDQNKEKGQVPIDSTDKFIFQVQSKIDEVDSLPENTKRNTPEMERKNIMDKLKNRGRDLMHRITQAEFNFDKSNANSPDATLEDNKGNMFFNKDETDKGLNSGDLASPMPYKNQLVIQLDGQAKYWVGKDYVNFIMKDFVNLDMPYADLVDRATTVRMPWHDIATVVVGHAARDVARHFIERWNAVKLEKCRENLQYSYLLPKSYNDVRIDPKFLPIPLQRVSCQVLRSGSSWNCGFIDSENVEQSIHEAYLQTISKAEHYLYIENQFFISLELGNPDVQNQIAETLYKRIIRAYREKKVFRVYVVMPLLPGFEGDVGGDTGISLRAITHWNYASISRGKRSLLSRLKSAGVEDPFEYISFHSLRTHSKLNGVPVTELIYVHSKLLICDDKTVICGSANINDRSLIGKRDSEVAVIINDETFEDGVMNGSPYPCGIYAGKLRKYLFREHMGLLEPDPARTPIDVRDPVIDKFWNGAWRRTSRRNTLIYDEIFRCIPSDNVKSFVSLKKFAEEKSFRERNLEDIEKAIKRIEGHLVDLPLEFLCNEILTPPSNTREGFMPKYLWT